MDDGDSSFTMEEKTPRNRLGKRKNHSIDSAEEEEILAHRQLDGISEKKWIKDLGSVENYDKLPKTIKELERLLLRVNDKVKEYKNAFFQEQNEITSTSSSSNFKKRYPKYPKMRFQLHAM